MSSGSLKQLILPADRPAIAVALACYLAMSIPLFSADIVPFHPASYLHNSLVYLACFALYLGFRILRLIWQDRPEQLFLAIKDSEFNSDRLRQYGQAMPLVLCLIIYMPMFSAAKSSIPMLNEFGWDRTFADLDRLIHGADVWKLLHPFFGYPALTFVISLLYHLWVLIIYFGSLFFLFYEGDGRLRLRYFVCYFVVWFIVGIVMATMFASVGPIFVGPIFGWSDFDPLQSYLSETNELYPLLIIQVQQSLLESHYSGNVGLGRGISAMPSMHVALSCLFYLAVRKLSPFANWFFGIFLVVMCIGSIHTGYHYAVDGYIAIIVTGILWWTVGRMLKDDQQL